MLGLRSRSESQKKDVGSLVAGVGGKWQTTQNHSPLNARPLGWKSWGMLVLGTTVGWIPGVLRGLGVTLVLGQITIGIAGEL